MTINEQTVIAAAIAGNTAGVMALGDDEFTDKRLRDTAAVIRDMVRRDEPVDLVTVAGRLDGRIPGSWLSELICPSPAFASYYAGLVRDDHVLRRAVAVTGAVTEALTAPGAIDHLPTLISTLTDDLSALPPRLSATTTETVPTVADLLDAEYPTNPLIPGLIHRGERVVLVAGEGAGKSVLLTQIGIGLAAGCHPFTGAHIADPMRVLLIDAENSPAQSQRRFRWVGERFHHAQPGWARNIAQYHRPEGVDLPGRDRAWLHKICAATSPDLILITPAYKVTNGDPQRDSEVMKLLQCIDEVRVRHDAAVIIETHATHGQDPAGERIMRPYGSSVWLRWPEIGLGLSRRKEAGEIIEGDYTVGHWRGMREDRDWPDIIRRSKAPELPWSPVRSDYWQTAVKSA